VLVLGASGFIGRWVARALNDAGADLVLIVRSRAAAEPILSRWGVAGAVVEADLASESALAETCREVRPSVTFNLAGYGVDPSERDEETAFGINAGLVDRLAALLAGSPDPRWPGRHLVHVGSALEYGDVAGIVTEETRPCPSTLYGRSKLRGTELLEQACRRSALRAVTARLFMVYGAGEHEGRLLPQLIRGAGTDADLHFTGGEQQRDFTYVEDAAEGLLRLGLSPGPAGIVNLATGHLTRVRDVVELTAAQLGIRPGRLHFGSLATRAEEMGRVTNVSIARLRHDTGWVPATGLREGIGRMLRRHGELVARP
jgi:nucleoside-diphosphate-sugar epimerase